MSSFMYQISRAISILTVLLMVFLGKYDFERNCYLIISLIVFLLISILYEKKNVYFNVTYSIYFVVLFFSMNIMPFSYIHNEMMLSTIERVPLAYIPSDHYFLYFWSFISISFISFVYIALTVSRSINIDILFSRDDAVKILVMGFVLFPLFIFGGDLFRKVYICFTSFFISYYFFNKDKKSWIYLFGLFISIALIISQLTWRFVLIQYLLPIVFFFIFRLTPHGKKISLGNKIKVMIFGLLGLIFSIVSEMDKLGYSVDVNELIKIFSNLDLLYHWINRQLYRVIGIWTVLGGNIIDYANENGYFYGLTYVKSLSSVLMFDYINLPQISASLVGASYAQPGLIAEGYANFGFIGGVLNACSVLILSEIMWKRFQSRQTIVRLLLCILPFMSIIVDGGSLNSVIYNLLFLLFTCLLLIFKGNTNKL